MIFVFSKLTEVSFIKKWGEITRHLMQDPEQLGCKHKASNRCCRQHFQAINGREPAESLSGSNKTASTRCLWLKTQHIKTWVSRNAFLLWTLWFPLLSKLSDCFVWGSAWRSAEGGGVGGDHGTERSGAVDGETVERQPRMVARQQWQVRFKKKQMGVQTTKQLKLAIHQRHEQCGLHFFDSVNWDPLHLGPMSWISGFVSARGSRWESKAIPKTCGPTP